jgi:hypothetical protein
MTLSDKVKVALEETRILILGAQILLGFGFRGVFAERFDQLPPNARYLDALGLALSVCVVALLIAPVITTASLNEVRTVGSYTAT